MIQHGIHYEWQTDSHFAELKEAEMLQERLNLLQSMNFADEIIGNFYSKEHVRTRILKQTREEIQQIDKEIEAEKAGPPIGRSVDIDKEIEAEKAAAPDEPEDEFQSFKPKSGKPLKETKIHNLKERISNVG